MVFQAAEMSISLPTWNLGSFLTDKDANKH